jgi:hypothetical protein
MRKNHHSHALSGIPNAKALWYEFLSSFGVSPQTIELFGDQ